MKYLEIEWRHLDKDGKTCERCAETGMTTRRVLAELSGDLNVSGWEISFKETLLTENEIPESNIILLNGVPIEELLPRTQKIENCCTSCGELLGASTMCRAIVQDGETYDAIPAALIRKAVCQFINRSNKGEA
jgi:hypothetical protein